MKRAVFLLILVIPFIILSPSFAQSPAITNGLSYLSTTQNPEGSWNSDNTEVLPATVSAIETLQALNETSSQNYTNALTWLQTQNLETTDYLAERINTLSIPGTDLDLLLSYLDQVYTGAWGGYQDFEANILDTALTTSALKIINHPDFDTIGTALFYLTNNQNADGGFGSYAGDDSSVYMTALVSAALQQFSQTTSLATAINKATSYLIAHQNIDGGFAASTGSGQGASTVNETSLAYIALVGVTTDNTVLGNAINYLNSTQLADGSWNQDSYSTALALRALYLSENRPVPPPSPTTGTVTGKAVDASTNQPLGGVTVVLQADLSINDVTDITGSFTLANIPPGSQKINFSLSGYATSSVTVNITAGSIVHLGSIPLSSNPTTGIIKGTVKDAANGQPLSDVTITVAGSFTGSAATAADGTFIFTDVTSGAVTIAATKSGYNSVTGTASVTAGGILFFNPMLTASPQQTPGTIIGNVVDAATNQALSGVSVVVQGISTTTDASGNFTLSNIPSGNQTITFSLSGYATSSVTVNITAGSIVHLGSIPLSSNPTTGIIKGTVTDAANGQLLSDVTITVTGSFTGSTVTSVDGTFIFTNITPGSVTITASKTGYYSVTGTGTVATGGILFFNPQLSTQPPPTTTGNLTGKVFDAATSTPIQGATISISDGSSSTSDALGAYLINDINPSTYQITISASGYTSQVYQVMILAGVTTDMQTINLSPAASSTTVTGKVTDASNGNPIEGADVVVVGTSLSVKTDSAGTYAITGINLLEFSLKVSIVGYDSHALSIKTTAYGIYPVDFALNQSMASNVRIVSLMTDGPEYLANYPVTITATIENIGDTAIDVLINAQILDQDNNILAFVSHQAEPALTLNPGGPETISLQWDTGLYPPGHYNVILSVVDSEEGILLADGYTTFDIASTIAIDGLEPLMSPKFINIKSTETIILSASVTNSSNIDVSLSAEYEVRDTNGNFINGGTVDFAIAPSESLKVIELGQFTYTFAASGQYPVTVKIRLGGSVVLENSDAIHVSPSMRIDSSKSLTPTTVVPDGDKRIRIDIRLQGVEVVQ